MAQNRLWHARFRVLFFGLIGGRHFSTLCSPVGWNENVVVSWEHHTEQNQEQTKVRQNKTGDHHWVVSQGIEFRIREAEHNG